MHESLWIGIIIITVIVAAELCDWLHRLWLQHKAKQKSASAEPVDGTDWLVYDSKARIKQDRAELMESMEKWRKEG